MDPNEALKKARAALTACRKANDEGRYDDERDEAESALSHFEALDEWLTKGGFMPDAWYQRRGAIVR